MRVAYRCRRSLTFRCAICLVVQPSGLPCIFFFQAEDGIRDYKVTGVQTCALPISSSAARSRASGGSTCGRPDTSRPTSFMTCTISGATQSSGRVPPETARTSDGMVNALKNAAAIFERAASWTLANTTVFIARPCVGPDLTVRDDDVPERECPPEDERSEARTASGGAIAKRPLRTMGMGPLSRQEPPWERVRRSRPRPGHP